jgi:hypothetical protein
MGPRSAFFADQRNALHLDDGAPPRRLATPVDAVLDELDAMLSRPVA